MNTRARMACLSAGMLVVCGLAPAQIVRVSAVGPPVGRAPQGPPGLIRLGATAAPPVREPGRILPLPREGGRGLTSPPRLGAPLQPGERVGHAVTTAPLQLAEVLGSVTAFYPAIRAAEEERGIRAGAQMSARGAFDLSLRSGENFNRGTYDWQRYSVGLTQATPFLGAGFYAGYRLGAGDYPVYYGDRKTAEGGEFQAGATLPLLRNRDIDQARASIQRADIDRTLVEPTIHRTRLDVSRSASRAYWAWVAAGQRYLIARDVLRLAQTRDEQLGKRVAAGNLAQIEREDNRRAIVEREARLVASLRTFQQAGFELSLYYRGADGLPLLPRMEQLPAFALPEPPPGPEQREKDLGEALTRRPEVQRLMLQRQRAQVDLRLAENQALPGLNLSLGTAQDVGFGKRSPQSTSRLNRDSTELSLLFDVPLQRRDARGRQLAARSVLAQLTFQEQLARDRIGIEVGDAANALDRAYDLLRRGRDNRLQSAYLAEAERRLFDIGKSDLFRVNIRELTAAEARFLEIDAAAGYFRALADYVAALGLDPTLPGPAVVPAPQPPPVVPAP